MTGRIQFCGFGAASDTPTYAYKGVVTGGNHSLDSELLEFSGIGSAIPLDSRPGLASGKGSVNFDINDDMKLLIKTYGLRTAGALPHVALHCGDTIWSAKHLWAMCTGWTIHGEAPGKLVGTYSWITRKGAEAAGAQAMSLTAATPFYIFYEFAMTGITGVTLRSFDITARHNTELVPLLATPAAGAVRLADDIADGGQGMVDLRLALRENVAGSFTPLADTNAKIASVVITYTSGLKTCIITLTNVTLTSKAEDLVPARIATRGLTFQAENCIVA